MFDLVLSFIPTLPDWLVSIGTAAVGALLAYALWSWLHSPHLYPSEVIHQEVVEVDQEQSQQSIRLDVKNIGTKAAVDCEATAHVRVPLEDKVVRSYMKLPWLPERADLVVEDGAQHTRSTIPAGRSVKSELIRQQRTGNVDIHPNTGGDKFLITTEGDDYHRSANSVADFAILSTSGTRSADKVQTRGTLKADKVKEASWDESQFEVTIETASTRPLKIDFDVQVDEDGRLSLKKNPVPLRRRLITRMYLFLNKIRESRL